MELCTFAIDGGFPEAILRGQKLSLIPQAGYDQMKAITSMKGLKDFLIDETDFKDYFPDTQLTGDIESTQLMSCLKNKLADELRWIEANSINPLNEFIHFLKIPYMIDNIVSVVAGMKAKTSVATLKAHIHPLGNFEELEQMLKTESDDITSLWETVFIDSPLSGYFLKFFNRKAGSGKDKNFGDVDGFFKEISSEQVRAGLQKLWIEDFLLYCETLNPISADNMTDILMQKADFMSIKAVYNTLSWEKQERTKTRSDVMPACGYLYQDHYNALIDCDSFDTLKENICKHYPAYRTVVEFLPDPSKTELLKNDDAKIEEAIYKYETARDIMVFDEQCNYAAFYSFMALREQELRNISWVTQMISFGASKQDTKWSKIILPMERSDI